MDTLIRFLKTSGIFFLVLLFACGHSEDEIQYLQEVKSDYPKYVFSLTDPVTGLELSVNLATDKVDSTELIQLFKEVKGRATKYKTVNWVYLVVKNGDRQLAILRELPGSHEVIFIKEIDR